MKKSSLVALAFSFLLAMSAFAAQTETNIEYNDLNSADELSTTDMNDDALFHRHLYRCFAENRHGRKFEAEGLNPHEAQERALHKCYHFGSRDCRPLGCHRAFE